MKFTMFRKGKPVELTASAPVATTAPEPTADWFSAEGYEGLEILVERPVIVQVRKGPIGSRTYGKYRLPTGADLGDFIADKVAEFNEKGTNPDAS